MEHEFALNILKNARRVGRMPVREFEDVDYRAANNISVARLANLSRIAGELHKLSRMERATSHPLKQDTKRLIDHSKRLVEQSKALNQQVAATCESARSI